MYAGPVISHLNSKAEGDRPSDLA